MDPWTDKERRDFDREVREHDELAGKVARAAILKALRACGKPLQPYGLFRELTSSHRKERLTFTHLQFAMFDLIAAGEIVLDGSLLISLPRTSAEASA